MPHTSRNRNIHGSSRAGAASRWSLDVLWLSIILLAGVALRVREALRTPMWFDEVYTWWASRGGPAEALVVSMKDVHPPLHFFLLGAWGAMGDSTLWLRSQSILFGTVALLVTFLMTREMFGRGAAFLATAALAIHPTHVHFSQEVRSYALLWMLLPATWWFTWRWVAHGRPRDAALYVVCAAAALYTHYFAGIILAFSSAWALFALITRPKRLLVWVAWNAGVAAVFAPQALILRDQIARLADSHWIQPPSLRALADWPRHMAYSALYLVPAFAVAALVPLLRPGRRAAAALLWLVAIVPPVLLWWLTTRGAHLYTERYMFYGLPAAAALAAAGIVSLPRAVLRWGAAAVLLLFGARALWLTPAHEEALWLEEAAYALRADLQPGDVVFTADTHSLLFMQQLFPRAARYRLIWPDGDVPYYEGAAVIPDSVVTDPAEFSAHTGRWWAMHTRHGGRHNERLMHDFRARAAETERTIGSVTVWGPAGGSPPEPAP